MMGKSLGTSATSIAARKSMKGPSKNQRQRIWEYVKALGRRGAISEEIALGLNMKGSAVRPRLLELQKMGRISKTVMTRQTKSNRDAFIYVAVAQNAWVDKRKGWPTPVRAEANDELAMWKRRALNAREAYQEVKKKLDDFAAKGIV